MAEIEQEDMAEIIELLEAQDDVYVAHARLFIMGDEYHDQEIPECSYCAEDIPIGAEFLIWGRPMAQTKEGVKDAKYASLGLFCSEEHLLADVTPWAEALGFEDIMQVLHR